jgi:hypothetical protein
VLTSGLDVDDVPDHVVLRRAQDRALGFDTTRDVAHTADGQGARPLDGNAVHAPRDAAARLDEMLDRYLRVGAFARVEPCDGPHAFGVQGRQAQRRVGAQPRRQRGILGCD